MVSFGKGNGNIWEPMSRFGSRHAISENPLSYCSSALRFLCRYSREKWNSEFMFVTYFLTEKRPFYTMDDTEYPGVCWYTVQCVHQPIMGLTLYDSYKYYLI